MHIVGRRTYFPPESEIKRQAVRDRHESWTKGENCHILIPKVPFRMFRSAASDAPSAKSASAVWELVLPIWRVNWPLKSKVPRVGKGGKSVETVAQESKPPLIVWEPWIRVSEESS